MRVISQRIPDLVTSYERRCAERTLKDGWSDSWETIFGMILGPSESCENDQRALEVRHADDWIVVSAITSSHRAGSVIDPDRHQVYGGSSGFAGWQSGRPA